jgi:NAD(P)-dependent dehydrogenase (short-subunit alcohol dehydrogenase family)
MPTSLVTGANRGIGLELARQLAERGDTVVGTARDPAKATDLTRTGARIEALDVSDASSVTALGKRLKGTPIDLLVNNAAIGEASVAAARVSVEELERAMRVNAIGAFHVTQTLLPNVLASEQKRIVSISSGLGSIGNNRDGGWVAYRASKSALHHLTRCIAAEQADDGITCVLLSPGWVRTRMGGSDAPLSPEQSVKAMLKVIDGLTRRDNGRFLDHRGKEIAW